MPATNLRWLFTMVCLIVTFRTCRSILWPSLTAQVLWSSATSTTPGASPSARLAAWPAQWVQFSRSATAAMSTTKRQGCTISEPAITTLLVVVSSTWILFCSRNYWVTISKPTAAIILYYILTATVATLGKMFGMAYVALVSCCLMHLTRVNESKWKTHKQNLKHGKLQEK